MEEVGFCDGSGLSWGPQAARERAAAAVASALRNECMKTPR
jgi:hypothetical protein